MGKSKSRGNGDGTIYNNGTYWVSQICLGRNPTTGKLIRKSFYGKSKKEAKEKMLTYSNKKTSNSSPTLSEWSLYWLENFKKPQLRQSTFEKYSSIIAVNIITPLGNYKLTDITPFLLQDYFNSLSHKNLSNSYISLIYKRLNTILKKAVSLDLISKNPCSEIILPKNISNKQIHILSLPEQKKFINLCSTKGLYGKIFILMLATGIRVGEAVALKKTDFNFDTGFISVNKTAVELNSSLIIQPIPKTPNSIRLIPITPFVKDLILTSITSKTDFIFSSNNKPFSPSTLRYKIKKYCAEANITPINIHALRHTFATRALEKNVNIKVLSEILGHSDIKITLNTYTHISSNFKKAELSKIDIFN